jgi:hypothetical protein
LLLIDVPEDFRAGGSLAIPGADADTERMAAFVRNQAPHLNEIVATLDLHDLLHIAHASFWISGKSRDVDNNCNDDDNINDEDNNNEASTWPSPLPASPATQRPTMIQPKPFAIISAQDIERGVWQPIYWIRMMTRHFSWSTLRRVWCICNNIVIILHGN